MRNFDAFSQNDSGFPSGGSAAGNPAGRFGRRGGRGSRPGFDPDLRRGPRGDHPQHPGRPGGRPGQHGGPRGGFPPEFGPGPDADPRRGERFGRGRGKGRGGRAGRGDLRTAILLLLNEEPMHGYQLMSTIGERTEGHWTPSPGATYPTLSVLEDEGLIEVTKEAGRKLATITPAGAELVAAHAEEWASFFDAYKEDSTAADDAPFGQRGGSRGPHGARGDDGQRGGRGRRGGPGGRGGHQFYGDPELMEAIGALRQALMTVDPDKAEAARGIVEQAVADITALRSPGDER